MVAEKRESLDFNKPLTTMVKKSNPPTVVLEPAIDPHDPALYEGEIETTGVAGFGAVDDTRLASYRAHGFLVIHGAFDEDAIRAARDELHRMAHSDDPQCDSVHYEGGIAKYVARRERLEAGKHMDKLVLGHVFDGLPGASPEIRAGLLRKFMGFCAHHPPLAALAHHSELLGILQRLVGEPLRLFQEMALVKPPGGREKPWHQDHAYFNFPLDTRVVGVWIALDQVDVGNGCMVVLPGGHLQGPRIHFMRRDYQICDSEIHEQFQQRVALPMQPGDLLLFDGKLPHGTPTNHTQGHRWAVQYHYVGESVRTDAEIDYREEFGSEGKNVTC